MCNEGFESKSTKIVLKVVGQVKDINTTTSITATTMINDIYIV